MNKCVKLFLQICWLASPLISAKDRELRDIKYSVIIVPDNDTTSSTKLINLIM